MVTPTLFDVAAITRLHPTGEDFDPNYMDEDTNLVKENPPILYILPKIITKLERMFWTKSILLFYLFGCQGASSARGPSKWQRAILPWLTNYTLDESFL